MTPPFINWCLSIHHIRHNERTVRLADNSNVLRVWSGFKTVKLLSNSTFILFILIKHIKLHLSVPKFVPLCVIEMLLKPMLSKYLNGVSLFKCDKQSKQDEYAIQTNPYRADMDVLCYKDQSRVRTFSIATSISSSYTVIACNYITCNQFSTKPTFPAKALRMALKATKNVSDYRKVDTI